MIMNGDDQQGGHSPISLEDWIENLPPPPGKKRLVSVPNMNNGQLIERTSFDPFRTDFELQRSTQSIQEYESSSPPLTWPIPAPSARNSEWQPTRDTPLEVSTVSHSTFVDGCHSQNPVENGRMTLTNLLAMKKVLSPMFEDEIVVKVVMEFVEAFVLDDRVGPTTMMSEYGGLWDVNGDLISELEKGTELPVVRVEHLKNGSHEEFRVFISEDMYVLRHATLPITKKILSVIDVLAACLVYGFEKVLFIQYYKVDPKILSTAKPEVIILIHGRIM